MHSTAEEGELIRRVRAGERDAFGGRGVALSAAAAPSADDPAVEPKRFDERGMWAEPPVRWTQETPRELALQRDTRAVIEAAIDELPLALKAVLVLRDFEGLEMDEIRDLLEIAVPDRRVFLHRARVRVARALGAHARGGRAAAVRSGPRGGSEGPRAARSIYGA